MAKDVKEYLSKMQSTLTWTGQVTGYSAERTIVTGSLAERKGSIWIDSPSLRSRSLTREKP